MANVIYHTNGSTTGSVPVDSTNYSAGAPAVVLGNTGSLARNSDIFAYWNTQADGLGSVVTPGASVTLPGVGNFDLYAWWYTTTGLTAGGATTHMQCWYDPALATAANGNIEPGRTNALIANGAGGIPVCENDYNIMNNWFGNIGLPASFFPIGLYVANLGGGASWGSGPPITLKPGGGGSNSIRDLIVAEVTEMFMYQQILLGLPNQGWGDNSSEESNGEGLSHYLMEQFQIGDGRPPGGSFNAPIWLNSSLPTGTPGSTRIGPAPTNYDFGSRLDYAGLTIGNNGNTPASGCSVLFLWYLTTQLGFTPAQICQAAATTISGVYRNMTGDSGDPFPLFKSLIDNVFPEDVQSNIPPPNRDNPFPLARLSFWVDKSMFGRDEVLDVIASNMGRWENAFWLVLEGFNKNTYNSLGVSITAFSGTFKTSIPGIQIVPNVTLPVKFETNDPNIPQRIRLAYDIIFVNNAENDSLNAFPMPGDMPVTLELDTSVTIGGNVITGSGAFTSFELIAGADPYFTNVNPNTENDYWLSQDLRVFTVTPGIDNSPFGTVAAGKPVLSPSDNINLYPQAGFQYAQDLLTYLNNNYTTPAPGGTDPFLSLPGNGTAFSDASSVAQYHFGPPPFNLPFYQNYSFAIARVRLKGTAGPMGAANDVRVFFRLWKAQTPDTDFGSTDYPSNLDMAGFPDTPLPGTGNSTIPLFATGNYSSNNDYVAGANINRRNVQINSGDSAWAYFVCYLNLFDPSNTVNGESVVADWPVGTHHCLVAQIAYDQAPITNTGITRNPENCDKLAQRNLQLTYSDNPGIPATHRVPQAFDIVPSKPLLNIPGSLFNYPDELMIDWGSVPVGATANIYWPQANSADVISLANSLYGTHLIAATDAHTIQMKVTNGVTYVPVPVGSGENFAGLFTVDLPQGVVAGQVFNIIVRKISTHGRRDNVVALNSQSHAANSKAKARRVMRAENDETGAAFAVLEKSAIKNWRYVTGTFQVRIPVTTEEVMLLPEENTLAIMKARLNAMSPGNRWYPVLQRYLQYIVARVDGLGGDAAAIKPSFNGIANQKAKPGETEPPVTKDRCCREVIWLLAFTIVLLFILILILIFKK